MFNKKAIAVFLLVIVLSMVADTFHPYLWGPDEPREAEIAREIYETGKYTIPHLCGVPILEKPPLYHIMTSASYIVAGKPDPGTARFVSVLLGLMMVAGAYFFGRLAGGIRQAVIAVALLMVMPQFYRAAHFILLDIGVGAFATWSIIMFGLYALWEGNRNKKWILYLFYLFCALSFLTKGVIGIFHVAVVSGTYIIITKEWSLVRKMLSPLPLAMFLLPVVIWAYILYQEGDINYLNEHFINNNIGRFFHINLSLRGEKFLLSDVGNSSPVNFYIARSAAMFGPVTILLPFVIWSILLRLNLLPRKLLSYIETKINTIRRNAKYPVINNLLGIVYDKPEVDSHKKKLLIYLTIWAFVPVILLSFSSIKEVTYILPSYIGIALLSSGWIIDKSGSFSLKESSSRDLLIFALIVSPVAFASLLGISTASFILYIIIMGIWLCIFVIFAIASAFKKHYTLCIYATCALTLSGIIVGNNPEVMLRTKSFYRKCFYDMAHQAWSIVQDKTLYVYKSEETLMGSIPFYGNKTTPLIFSNEQLKSLIDKKEDSFVIMEKKTLDNFHKSYPDSNNYKVMELPSEKLHTSFLMIKINP